MGHIRVSVGLNMPVVGFAEVGAVGAGCVWVVLEVVIVGIVSIMWVDSRNWGYSNYRDCEGAVYSSIRI